MRLRCEDRIRIQPVAIRWVWGVVSTLEGGLGAYTPADVTRERESAGDYGNRPTLLPHVPRVFREVMCKD